MHSRAALRPQRTVCVSELTMLPAWNFLRRNSHYTGFAAAMAPVYGVDHSLSDQDAATDALYKDYGPLFRALQASSPPGVPEQPRAMDLSGISLAGKVDCIGEERRATAPPECSASTGAFEHHSESIRQAHMKSVGKSQS